MNDSWLIRMQNDNALIWKRKYFMGLPVPWALHGGTRIVRTPATSDNVLEAAIDYIKSQYDNSEEQIKVRIEVECGK